MELQNERRRAPFSQQTVSGRHCTLVLILGSSSQCQHGSGGKESVAKRLPFSFLKDGWEDWEH